MSDEMIIRVVLGIVILSQFAVIIALLVWHRVDCRNLSESILSVGRKIDYHDQENQLRFKRHSDFIRHIEMARQKRITESQN